MMSLWSQSLSMTGLMPAPLLRYLHIQGFNWKKGGKYLKKKFCDIPEKNRTWICHSSSTVYTALTLYLGFPGGSDSKESVCNAGDTDLIPGLGRSPGVGNGNPLQYSCLENSMDREAWRATVHGVAKSRTRLSDCLYSATSPWGALIPLFLT